MESLIFSTELGHTALTRNGDRVLALVFGHTSKRAALNALARNLTTANDASLAHECLSSVEQVEAGYDQLVDLLYNFADGVETDFRRWQTDVSHLTPFGRKVTAECRKIAWGETLSYGELAKRAGRPGAARAVGSVMARNRVPLIVPCHRVVPACGGLGGFSAPQGVSMKRRLLERERDTNALLVG